MDKESLFKDETQWRFQENGTVRVNHSSPSSAIELVVLNDEGESKTEYVRRSIWLTYGQFTALREIMNRYPSFLEIQRGK